jgi:excisionase family DNA binding protein
LKTSEVAHLLNVSPKTISRWAKEGRLPYMATLGGHRRFPETEIQRLTDDLNRTPGQETQRSSLL